MIASLRAPNEGEVPESFAYVEGEFVIPPMTLAHVNLRIPEVQGKHMPSGDGIIRGETEFMDKTDLHPWSATIVNCPPEGRIIAGVINSLEDPITIQDGTRYGRFQLSTTPEGHDQCPWRINLIKDQDSEHGDPPGVTPEETIRRLDTLNKVFKLTANPMLKRTIAQKRALTLLPQHWDLFSLHGSLGKTDLLKHHIRTPQDVPPIKQRVRKINPALEPDLRKQIDTWLHHGVIEKSNSPWNFGLVAAPKKNGTI